MILLDTSAAVFMMRGETPPEHCIRDSLGISTIVELELRIGVFHKGGPKELARVNRLLQLVEIYPFDSAAALKSGELIAKLWSLGTPIGDYDSQIAGHAIALSLPLLTGNAKHFERVEGLKVVSWNP
ncbi:MAG: type II toxin-antitoxin system VapC family toxin [Puniceicoccales bacterium]